MGLRRNIRQGLRDRANIVNDAVGQFRNFLGNMTSNFAGAIGGIWGGDVVGIKAAEVGTLRTAIVRKTTAIDNHLLTIQSSSDPAQAFADPGMQQSVREYVDAVTRVIGAYSSQLQKFATLLYNVENTYRDHQAEQASALSDGAAESRAYADNMRYETPNGS